MEAKSWFALTPKEVAETVHTDSVDGLSLEEVQERQAKGHPNELQERHRESFFRRVVNQLVSPIALLLVFAAPAALLVGTLSDALVIGIALLINVVIGVYQEERAERTFAALHAHEARFATVVRAGLPEEIPAKELVVGDVVRITAGSSVPADVRLIEAFNLSTNEAMLSGEWVPVEKQVEAVEKDAPLAERSSMAYAGTLVANGSARGIVVATGKDTEFGSIAASLAETESPETPLERDISRAGRMLLFIALGLILLVFVLAVLRAMPLSEAALIAIAIAVAAVPEGLPAAVTVALSLGMERILKKGGLVRGLLAAETLGATSIVLTDKTGTLTEGRMSISGFATLSGTTEDTSGKQARQLLRAAVLSSGAFIEQTPPDARAASDDENELIKVHGRPLEQAVVLAGYTAGISKTELSQSIPKLDELPFTAEQRFSGMLVEEEGKPVAYLSGVPELFIKHAHNAHTDAGPRLFTEQEAAFFNRALARAARNRERVIAVARAPYHEQAFVAGDLDALLDKIELMGFILFTDPIRPDAEAAVADLKKAGARVVMATGDNPDTALAVARAVGIAESRTRAHTGAELEALSDNELYDLVMAHPVFARVLPKDKLRIAQILSAHDEVVAMTGDGVNDAPALRAAAIGIALGSGTEVAKEASDLVLLHDSFRVITAALTEGRRLRDNIKKIFVFLIATNFSETFVIVAALAANFPLPLLPVQVLWSNLISGGAMNVAFAFEPLYASAMSRSPKDPETAHVLSRRVVGFIAVISATTGTLLVALLAFLQGSGIGEEQLRTMMFIGVSFSSFFTALSLKSFGTPLWCIPLASNRFLLYALALSVGLLMLVLFLPPLAAVVQVAPLSGIEMAALALLGFFDLVLVEIVKYFLFIRPDRAAKKVQQLAHA